MLKRYLIFLSDIHKKLQITYAYRMIEKARDRNQTCSQLSISKNNFHAIRIPKLTSPQKPLPCIKLGLEHIRIISA